MQYLKTSEMTGDDETDPNRVNYNNFMPHYQLGYALYYNDFLSLVDYLNPTSGKSLERPHNTMHNNMHFSMMDDNFSLTNVVFFLYHGWIDVMLEMKIRMCDNTTEGYKMYQYLNTESNREEYFDPLLNPNQESRKYGDYPIIEWADPRYVNSDAAQRFKPDEVPFEERVKMCEDLGITASSIKVAFPAMDYYLKDSTHLRKSTDLDSFYKNNYIINNIDNFKEFTGFADFNASFDIEIF